MKRLILPILMLGVLCIPTVDAQKSQREVIYTPGVPTTCLNGRIYVNVATGIAYTYKTGVGCFTPEVGGGAAEVSTDDVDTRLSTTTIDLGNTAAQDLYTVPAGKTLVVTKMVVRDPADATLPMNDGGTTTIQLIDSGSTAQISFQAITGVSATGRYLVHVVNQGAGSVFVTTGNKVQAKPNIDYGPARPVIIDLFGYTY